MPQSLQRLVRVGVTHETHDTERVGALSPADPVAVAERVRSHDRVTDAVVLATCNRVEAYVATRTADAADRRAARAAADDALGLPADATVDTGLAVAEHLARVAAGLESAVLGENEILGQLRGALADARDAGLTGGVLGRVGDAAVRAGRRARTETSIDEGPATYGSAVCRRLADELATPPDTVLLVGAGEMAESVAAAARDRWDARVDVANRSPAGELASPDGEWWPLEELADAAARAGAIVTATAADAPVFDVEHARACSEGTPVVDLAAPPDVSPAARRVDAVSVTGLDELAAVVGAAADRRERAARAAERVVAAAVDRLVVAERESRAEDTLRALHRHAADVRQTELDRAKQRLRNGEATPETVLEEFASALTGQLLAAPTAELRAAARERDDDAIRAAERLFDLDD